MESMIVAIDVVGEGAGVAWQTPSEKGWLPLEGKRPSATLLPALAACLKKGHLEKLGVVVGPGSFTGIRTGIATALGLKMSKNIQILGLNKFELMAFRYGQLGHEKAEFLIPNRGDRLYACSWNRLDGLGPAQEMNTSDLASKQHYFSTKAMAHPYLTLLEEPFAVICAEALRLGMGNEVLEPLYIRPADTRINATFIEKLLAKHRA